MIKDNHISKMILNIEDIIRKHKNEEIDEDIFYKLIKEAIKKKRGRIPSNRVKEREFWIASKVFAHTMELELGRTSVNKSNYINDLAEEVSHICSRNYSSPDIYKIYDAHKAKIMADEIDIMEMIEAINRE